ncbi:MAG: TetR family transcriptional regulator C-terminal domain-containing protein [Phormidesmis sp.]
MKRTHKREELIRIGRDIIVRQGFNATGLSNILTTAGVPKGSFYYYFDSKEDFGLAIIEDSAHSYQKKLERTIGNSQLSPLKRLNSYFEAGIAEMEACGCVNGCLIGNLAQEMAGQSEVFRDRLNKIFFSWEEQFANCLEAARETQEISYKVTPTDLAQFVLAGWQGAILQAKVARSTAPMQTFARTFFSQISPKSIVG